MGDIFVISQISKVIAFLSRYIKGCLCKS